MINNIRTDTVMDAVLAGLKQGIQQFRKSGDNNS
jgi:hypothetical protein